MQLSGEISATPTQVVVRCRGQIIFGNELEELVRRVKATNPCSRQVVIDLANIGEIRSSDLGTMWLRYMEGCALGWRFTFINLPDHVKALLAKHSIAEAFDIREEEYEVESERAKRTAA